jgi:DNA-binding LacI/PurR family transcriptional regulator
MAHKATLRDVAERAGVSVTTVSNVVRGWPHIADDTRSRVAQAIQDLGYEPHPIARWLRTGRTQAIGFIIPDITSPHFASLASIAEDIAQEHGYSVLVLNTHDEEMREAQGVRLLTNGLGDGILIVQTTNALQTTDLLQTITVPVVAIDRVQNTFKGAFCNVDNLEIARLALQHLYDLGHRRIAHLAGPATVLSAQDRVEGYQRFVEERGLGYRYISSSCYQWSVQEGHSVMGSLLDHAERPTAVFASNDRMAVGAAHAIRERGLRVPEDISLIGVDDIEVSQHFNPPLTTVRQPVREMARVGIEMLMQLIRGETPAELHVTLSPMLVVRASTAPPL